jgi:HK97 family phage major capsid protein
MFRMRNLFMFDADGDAGGGDMEALKTLGTKMGQSIEDTKELSKKVDEVANQIATLSADTDADIKKLATDSAKTQQHLAKAYGKSGAEDWLNQMVKFLQGVYSVKKGMVTPEGDIYGEAIKDLVGKAAADFTTTTSATAGYLLPDVLLPGITDLKDLYGSLYPLVTKVKAPAGQSIKINSDAAHPVAAWRGTQLTTITEEATPMSFGQDTMVSELLGSYIQIANELLMAPGVNFSAVATTRMLRAIMVKLEFGIISGTTGGGEPSDGIIADATDQGTIASLTWATLITFLKACLTDNDWAYDTGANTIILTPYDAMALAMELGAAQGAMIWGDSQNGVPGKLMGYNVLVHPAANNGTSKHILLGDLSTITLIEDSSFGVDISEHAGTAFVENASLLRCFNHYDWNLGQTAEWHKAVVTA